MHSDLIHAYTKNALFNSFERHLLSPIILDIVIDDEATKMSKTLFKSLRGQ